MAKSTCGTCGGSGKIRSEHTVYDPYERKDKKVIHEYSCGNCGGSGKVGQDDPKPTPPQRNDGSRDYD